MRSESNEIDVDDFFEDFRRGRFDDGRSGEGVGKGEQYVSSAIVPYGGSIWSGMVRSSLAGRSRFREYPMFLNLGTEF